MKVSLNSVLFIHCTFGYLVANILAATIPTLSLVFIALRDSWICIFLLIVFIQRKKENVVIGYVVVAIGLLGIFPIFEKRINATDLLIYLYGFRDICFVALVLFYLDNRSKIISVHYVYSFVAICFVLYLVEVIFQGLGFSDVYRNLFSIDRYFSSKGVESNLGGGIFGQRPSIPLYSPGLLATLFSSFILLSIKSRSRSILFFASIVTLSKVVAYFFVMRVFRRVYGFVLISVLLAIPVVIAVSEYVKDGYPNTIYSYHAHSVSEHISPLSYVKRADYSYLPDLLGSSSVLAHVITGKDSDEAPESLLVARFLDFNYLSIFLLLILIAAASRLSGERRFVFIVFLGLQFLTGLSNHPVAFLPLIMLMNIRDSYVKRIEAENRSCS